MAERRIAVVDLGDLTMIHSMARALTLLTPDHISDKGKEMLGRMNDIIESSWRDPLRSRRQQKRELAEQAQELAMENDTEKLYFWMLIATELAEKQRARTSTRYEEHRLLDCISAISQLTGKHGRDIWLDMVERDYSPTRT